MWLSSEICSLGAVSMSRHVLLMLQIKKTLVCARCRRQQQKESSEGTNSMTFKTRSSGWAWPLVCGRAYILQFKALWALLLAWPRASSLSFLPLPQSQRECNTGSRNWSSRKSPKFGQSAPPWKAVKPSTLSRVCGLRSAFKASLECKKTASTRKTFKKTLEVSPV